MKKRNGVILLIVSIILMAISTILTITQSNVEVLFASLFLMIGGAAGLLVAVWCLYPR